MIYHRSILSLFIILALLLSSIAPTVIGKEINKSITNFQESSPFLLKLSQNQLDQIEAYLDTISDNEARSEFQGILGDIIVNEDEFNILKLFEMFNDIGIDKIYQSSETVEFTDDLYMFLLNLIQERLGWIYDFLEKTSDIISDSQELWNDKGLPKEIISEIEILITTLQRLQNLLSSLVEKEYIEFLRVWSPGIIIEDITTLISSIQTIAIDLGILVGDIQRFIYDVADFIQWFSEEPWKKPIVIYGKVILGVQKLDNATLHCNGITTLSDQDGFFEFEVNTTLSNTSIPPQSFYGLHQCVVSITYEDQEKSTPVPLSYVFSDGAIYWFFILQKSNKSVDSTLENNVFWKYFFIERNDIYHPLYSIISRFLTIINLIEWYPSMDE